MARERVKINVGGKHFETFKNTLSRWPGTLLAGLNHDSIFWDEDEAEYFFDRDPTMFPVILNCYRFGEVHLPNNVCGPSMRREMEYWGIQVSLVIHIKSRETRSILNKLYLVKDPILNPDNLKH